MSQGRTLKAMAAAAILLGSASMAHAQSTQAAAKPKAAADFTVKGDFAKQTPLGPGQTLQFDADKGRWGLKLDLDQPAYREMQLKDVQAGAYFKVTPNVRVGASAGVDARSDLAPAPRKPEPVAPRVRLETAFKF
ncbi:MAG: hypothetical protein REJ23_16600 [Brevundimonas sp.]|nr:hypothetical protein [Brevundimonas sp.]